MFPAVDGRETSAPWTAEQVEARLVDAYRRLPSAPVYSDGGFVHTGMSGGSNPTTEALSWISRFFPNRTDAVTLLDWARCMATGTSFGEHCRERGRNRSTAEERRRRASGRIAACLNSEQRGLDNRKTCVGPTLNDAEAAPVLAEP